MEWPEVICPSCFEAFLVPPPSAEDLPSQMDYDCEICCCPMVLHFWEEGDGEILAEAQSLDD